MSRKCTPELTTSYQNFHTSEAKWLPTRILFISPCKRWHGGRIDKRKRVNHGNVLPPLCIIGVNKDKVMKLIRIFRQFLSGRSRRVGDKSQWGGATIELKTVRNHTLRKWVQNMSQLQWTWIYKEYFSMGVHMQLYLTECPLVPQQQT